MRIWMMAPLGLALVGAGCSGMTTDQSASSASAESAPAGEVGAFGQPETTPAADASQRSTDDEIAWRQRRTAPEMAADEAAPPSSAAAAPVNDLTNEEVRRAQTALRDMGFYDGEIDGLYGRRTIGAVGEFQAQQNMPRTLALDDRTQEALTRMARAEPGGQKGTQQAASGADGAPSGGTAPGAAQTGSPGGDAAMSQTAARSYGSVSQTQNFSGQVAGGYQAEELMGKQVVGANGQPIGEIADVLISEGGQADHVLVELSRELGIGTDKQVAIPTEQLSQRGDRFASQLSPEELRPMPSYTREGDRWTMESGGGGRGQQ